jgi:uroporphyrinogen decarboxylase
MKLLAALARQPLERPPIWLMRQAGRYLPEYRELRRQHSFQEAVHRPAVAAEITLQPLRRFDLDAAIIFCDIMTPLEAMGVEVRFDPGPKLAPMSVEEIAALPELDLGRVGFVAEAIEKVRAEIPPEVALIGFAGAPVTLLAYLLEGGGSRDFMALRSALLAQPAGSEEALGKLARSMRLYLDAQAAAGADVVQLFDTWTGILSREAFLRLALPAARTVLAGISVPSIYFAPHSAHLLDLFPEIGATGYGVDWRQPLGDAWEQIGTDHPIQGNLDPAVLLTDPVHVRSAVAGILDQTAGRPGHVFNLGHGVHRHTPIPNVSALVAAVRGEGA